MYTNLPSHPGTAAAGLAMPMRLALTASVLVSLTALKTCVAHRSKRWEQNCAAYNPDCRVPLEFRKDPGLNEASGGDGSKQHPKGHLKPLGHPDFADLWDGEIDVLDEMTPVLSNPGGAPP